MRSAIKKPSLTKDCLVLSIILIIMIIMISTMICYSVYHSQKQNRLLIYNTAAQQIDTSLTEAFDYAAYYMRFLGEKLIQNDNTDPNFLAELFYNKVPDKLMEGNAYAWSLFDFVSADKKMIVNSVKGKLEKPIDLSMRSYVLESQAMPWKMFFSTPSWGMASGEWVIPAGIGISDNKGRFYGTIATGFDIERLIGKLEKAVHKNGINFALLDSNFEIIAHSVGIKHVISSSFFIKGLPRELKNKLVREGELVKPITATQDDISFFYYKKSEKYPFYILIGENEKVAKKELREIIVPRIIELTFIGSFCITVLYYLRRRIVAPISALAKAARRITKEEDVIIPRGHYAEINELENQLQEIQQVKKQLINAREKIKESNESLEQKVIERTLELERALKARTSFLNNMSHEIKTPVHGVINFAEILVEDWSHMDDSKRLGYAVKIHKNSERLYSLVSNILDLSKLSASKMQFAIHEGDLAELIKEVIEECEPLYVGKKPLILEFKIVPKNLVTHAFFDQERITQVVRNLIANAIKFTPHGKIISTLQARDITCDDGRIIKGIAVAIEDEGIGIPNNELTEIFDVFSQSSRTQTLAGGTGLGLSICHEIISAHHGVIWAQNNPRKGSTFIFVIPYHL